MHAVLCTGNQSHLCSNLERRKSSYVRIRLRDVAASVRTQARIKGPVVLYGWINIVV